MTDTKAFFDGRPARAAIGLFPMALWFGLVGGSLQAAWATYARYELGRYTHLSRQIVWMAPVSAALVLAVPGALFWILERRRTRNWWQAAVTVYAAIAALGVLYYVVGLHPLARVALSIGVGAQTGRLAVRHRPFFGRIVRETMPLLAGLVLIVGSVLNAAIRGAERQALATLPAAPAGAPNVLLLILDTVRALDMSLYGYSRATTPHIDRFAGRGVVFDRAIAAAPWTLPSHASMFTGRAPHQLSADWRRPLDDRYPTLAEVLAARGYLTAGFAGNLAYASSESGLQRGFAHYEGFGITVAGFVFGSQVMQHLANAPLVRRLLRWHNVLERKSARGIHQHLVEWLDAHPGRPWFAFANFYDAHDPYLPPAPFDTAFTGRRIPDHERNYTLVNTEPVTAEAARAERDAYDQAMRWLDHEVGALLRDMEARGQLRNTVVVIAADHGEEFGEHGLLGHGNSLYLPSLRVPLIVVFDGVVPAGRRVAGTVSLRDLGATILDLTGSLPGLPGTSLRAQWTPGSVTGDAATAVAEVRKEPRQPAWFPASKGDMSSVVSNSRQLIRDGTGAREFYDLLADPTGATRADDEPGLMARLEALLPPKR